MLEYHTDSERYFIVQELAEIIGSLTQDEFGVSAAEYLGPLFFQHVRMNMLLVMSNSDDPGTLLDFYRIFNEESYYKRWLPIRVDDPELERWATKVLPRMDYLRQGSEGSTMGGYIASKFHSFVFDPLLHHLFGQKRSTIDLREIMDTGKVLLVNLAKGELTEANSRFLGMVLMTKLPAAATSRVNLPETQRRPFYVYVDEFQSIATQSFSPFRSPQVRPQPSTGKPVRLPSQEPAPHRIYLRERRDPDLLSVGATGRRSDRTRDETLRYGN